MTKTFVKIVGFTALVCASTVAVNAQPVANPDPQAVQAGTYGVEPYHTRINFTISHMGFTDWYGDFTGASGSLTLDPKNLGATQVEISIPSASISTTNTMLDGELKSAAWFDSAKFPVIAFRSVHVIKTGDRTADIEGMLTFHGVTKPMTLHAVFNAAGFNPIAKSYTVGFNATGTLKRSDFGVSMYLPLLPDDVALRISAGFEPVKK